MIEIWRAILGYEGKYEVSSQGRVRSIARVASGAKRRRLPEKIMSLVPDTDGYPTVRLHSDGRGVRFKVHRLVCAAFHGEPTLHQQAAHLNGKKDDARAVNLAWVTQSENEEHKRSHGTKMFGERHVQARLSLADVASIRARIAAGETQTAVRADYGISSGHISEIVTGLKWSEGESPVAAGHAPKPNPEAQSQQESAA